MLSQKVVVLKLTDKKPALHTSTTDVGGGSEAQETATDRKRSTKLFKMLFNISI